jgi:hypothetical protein
MLGSSAIVAIISAALRCAHVRPASLPNCSNSSRLRSPSTLAPSSKFSRALGVGFPIDDAMGIRWRNWVHSERWQGHFPTWMPPCWTTSMPLVTILARGDVKVLTAAKLKTLPPVILGSAIGCGLWGRIRAHTAVPPGVVPPPNTAKALAGPLKSRPAPGGLIVRPLT